MHLGNDRAAIERSSNRQRRSARRLALPALVLGLAAVATAAADEPPRWVSEGPRVATPSFSFALPVERVGTMLAVEVELGGKPRRFVFDTGSPSMIDATLATELGLVAVDRRAGRDSHGVRIESDIVQADLTIGGVRFQKVPMFATDFSASPAARCFLGDGILGSELLPLCAWQLDLEQSVLRCASSLGELSHVAGATRMPLHDFGYPHTPFLDVGLAPKATSKAMFDTGSPEYLAISPPDFAGAQRSGGIAAKVEGYGSAGGSLGGQAAPGKQLRGELAELEIGDLALGRVGFVLRESPPSLLGAALLEHFVVTLDARSGAAYFDRYRQGPLVRPSFGFTLAFEPEIAVAVVWDGSPAAAAGLAAGLPLTAIDGVATSASCEGMRRALEAMSGDTVTVEWAGGAATLSRAR